MNTAVPIFEAKNKLTLLIHNAEEQGPVLLSRHNKEVAVIISIDDYNHLTKLASEVRKQKNISERLQDFKEKYADLYEKSDLGKELELTIAERSHDKSLYRQNHDAWEGVFDD